MNFSRNLNYFLISNIWQNHYIGGKKFELKQILQEFQILKKSSTQQHSWLERFMSNGVHNSDYFGTIYFITMSWKQRLYEKIFWLNLHYTVGVKKAWKPSEPVFCNDNIIEKKFHLNNFRFPRNDLRRLRHVHNIPVQIMTKNKEGSG